MTSSLRGLTAAVLFSLAGVVRAGDAAAPQGVVSLSASASVEVPRDVLSVTLSASRDGADAAAVQAVLKQALDAALGEAKKVAKPGQVDVRAGSFALVPRYAKSNVIAGWQGSAEMVVEGRDMQAIAELTGRVSTMTIARVTYGISRELRERLEGDLAAQAIARYRAKAADYATQFGYASYSVREVNIASADIGPPMPAPAMMRAMASAGEAGLPVEPGRGTVTVTVAGSVQMMK